VAADTPTPISYALEFYADALVQEGKLGDAEAVFRELGEEVDRMRAGYWEYRRRECAQ
jgi:protein farnesyltransferase/geranylgeranyltransferase type-1 subunit alpha